MCKKKECNHYYKEAILLSNGDILWVDNYKCPTDEETHKYLENVAEERNAWMTGGGMLCVKCKSLPEELDKLLWI